ncbi:WXG100 family type VII secretion target [Streptomyces sp. TRM68367]|uniref:WXG100 family type VII secretion target n=1 Tax=Streptomyces sp. TRM68367 TaxID=2758415 RepID=UPI00165A6B2F|nr:WXG100 family type VII secretion target [Streptomyces sp. TRM68367]MBC9723662.1 WXG100 family type VII secretion target [Streptomyces sp. TRM68367]
MYGYGYQNPEYIKAQQEARERRIEDKHDEKLESLPNGGMGGPDRSQLDTPFMKMGIPELRSMILDADPGRIYEVSQHWKSIHNILSGGDGDGKSGGVDSVSAKDSVAGMMQSAIENVLEHWEGEASEAFRKKANEIMQNIRNGAAWANHYGEAMHAVQNDLRNSMSKMRDVEEPSGWDRAWDKLTDDGRSDEQLLKDINSGVSTDAARQANADSLSKGKEKQLEGVAIMEQLAVNYKVYARPPAGGIDDHQKDPFSPPNPGTPMPTPISMPSGGGTGPGAGAGTAKPWSAGPTTSVKPAPTVPRDPGITGGSQLPTSKTRIDSISPGMTGIGSVTGTGGGISGGGGGIGTGGAQGPGIMAPGGASGLAGGAAARGGIGAAGGRGGLAGGGAAAGRGAGGRAGMGGMGGAGAGAAGRGGAGAGGRGALARSRGGVVGAAKGVTGKGAGGGAGLHGSRGGSQRGGMAGGAGGVGGRNGRRSEEENSRGDRPDYLVEDEETWISEEDRNRNVPRTIE